MDDKRVTSRTIVMVPRPSKWAEKPDLSSDDFFDLMSDNEQTSGSPTHKRRSPGPPPLARSKPLILKIPRVGAGKVRKTSGQKFPLNSLPTVSL